MIKAIIIEDEQHCIDRLRGLLASHSNAVELLGAFSSVEEGIAAIKRFHPDVLFLDVELRDRSGFDLLREMGEIAFDVIFTTAFDKYAVQAFRFSAIDYLLKPIDPDDLQQAIEKLKAKKSREELSQKLEVLFHNLKSLEGASKKISIPTISGYVFLTVGEIIRCESDVNYTNIFLHDRRKLTVARTLKEFEEMLTEYNFFRVHNSHLINLAHIKEYNKGKGGYVRMMDNSEIEVSSRRKSEFLKRIAAG
jgi:two-component system LytT family response regulator